jgi:hypothetical protein
LAIQPYCAVCGFGADVEVVGGVSFADYRAAEPYALGSSPKGYAEFCRDHLKVAEKYRHLTIRDAFEHMVTDLADEQRQSGSVPGCAERNDAAAPAGIDSAKTWPVPTRPSGQANPSTVGEPVPSAARRPAPIEARWPFSAWYGDGAGATAPPCPRCGQPVRTEEAQRDRPLPGYANPPWNAGWNGDCEACGAAFELVIHTPLHIDVDRTTTVRPASRPYRTFIDEGFVLCGLEVTVAEREWRSNLPRTETLFLSMAELTQLADALQNSLKIYLDQLDWAHDWT